MALKLRIPGAQKNGRHEENFLLVKKWLKQTKKRWLMIFDNADQESEAILKGYWPLGAEGAILITSRTYYNFLKDGNRKGDTIKPFNDSEAWDLFLRILGKEYLLGRENNQLRESEVAAAKAWLVKLGGLPLSIQTAARLILSRQRADGTTIAEAYDTFKTHEILLPARQRSERSPLIQSLDALFDMTFTTLSAPARDLLSVLALLSPGMVC
jgi:hypothetical protein